VRPRAEGTISEFPEPARRDAQRSFDGRLPGVEPCDVVVDTALTEPFDGSPRRIRFVGPTLTVTVTCSDATQPGRVTVEVRDTDDGTASGPCRVTVLGEGRLDAVAHVVTDDEGMAHLAVPERVVSLLVTRADDVVAQTAWLRL
jgi:hypothetical protein